MSKYETNQQSDYAIGIGLGNNGVAINADVKKTWLYLDKETVAIGIKYKF
nr:MAG TPA: Polysaccharide lyase family 8, super-sandwich domain [Caudoviricetes sp.]